MIKLSRMSDYAVVVLETLSRQHGTAMSAAQLAETTTLPEPTVAKVLKQMASGGLVTSSRGVNGGYSMARTAAEMTIYDIVTVIEGRLGLTACVEGHDEPCALSGACAMTGRWDPVNRAVRQAFESITLADMMRQKVSA